MPAESRTPLVSVLMPVYNAEKYLAAAVESVLDQTLGNFELIAVDDGSKDCSRAILAEYEARDPRVKVISRPNTGIVGALNDGLGAARGEFVARMDSDDISLPRRFEIQVAAFRSDPQLVAVGTGWRKMSADGSLEDRRRVLTDHAKIFSCLMLGRAYVMLHPSVMIRRDAIERAGGYRQHMRNMHEELDLYLRLEPFGKFGNVRKVLVYYRQHPASNVALATDQAQRTEAADAILREAYQARRLRYPPDWATEWMKADPVTTRIQEGWNRLKRQDRWGALSMALGALRGGPLEPRAWRLMACAFRGH